MEDKYKKSIDCNNPKGLPESHCQGKKKKMNEDSYQKIVKQLRKSVGIFKQADTFEKKIIEVHCQMV